MEKKWVQLQNNQDNNDTKKIRLFEFEYFFRNYQEFL